MAKINKNFKKLQRSYLFIEIANRTKAFAVSHPEVTLMRLGIGDTTEPLSSATIAGLRNGVENLAKRKTYTGYGDEAGNVRLRGELANWYAEQNITIDPSEIFVSDGAKSDTSNIQSLFSLNNIVAIQDPVYPVYVDSNVIAGRTGKFVDGAYDNLTYLVCTEANNFIPKIPDKKVDVIYLCSPNNPTGAVMTREQLTEFVVYAKKHKAIIIFDAAYSMFIKDNALPRSIYEIDGAKTCAIEISSFSKWAGFTGVRLGWTVVPKELVVEDSEIGDLNALWRRRQTTMFNGASNIAQEGGLAVLSQKGQKESKQIINYYMENALMVKTALVEMGMTVYGGENAPYIWIKTPNGLSSWEFFDKLLNETFVVGTPGVGFGKQGEGYFRFSSFGKREDIKKAVISIQENLQL